MEGMKAPSQLQPMQLMINEATESLGLPDRPKWQWTVQSTALASSAYMRGDVIYIPPRWLLDELPKNFEEFTQQIAELREATGVHIDPLTRHKGTSLVFDIWKRLSANPEKYQDAIYSVLRHEMGHLTHDHSTIRPNDNRKAYLLAIIALLVIAGLTAGVLLSMPSGHLLTKLLVGGEGAALAGFGAYLAYRGFQNFRSRQDEREADRFAVFADKETPDLRAARGGVHLHSVHLEAISGARWKDWRLFLRTTASGDLFFYNSHPSTTSRLQFFQKFADPR